MIRIPYDFIHLEWQMYQDGKIVERRPHSDGYWFGNTYGDYIWALEDRMAYPECILNKRREMKMQVRINPQA